ncbi:MAG: hypothetical protein WD751_01275 [Anaerolineales bacterium]
MLTFTGAQLLRAGAALNASAVLTEYHSRVHPALLIASGLVWGALAFWLTRGLWRGEAWAPKAARWGLLAFIAYDWVDRLAFQSPGPQGINWPFALLAEGVLTATVFGILALPGARAFYGAKE